MRIVFWGTYDIGKPRVRLLRDGLRQNGFDLIECHADVWSGIEDKSQVTGLSRKIGLAIRWLSHYPGLLWRYLRLPPHDMVLVSYPGLLDVLLIKAFARLRGVSVVWDVFISAYDTVVIDRRLVKPLSPLAWMLWGLEWLGIRSADLVFMDTRTHARRLEKLFSMPEGSCGSVWVGAEVERFAAESEETGIGPEVAPTPTLRVLFYGQFIPLHGIQHIVEAARLLRDASVDWVLIGQGQEATLIRTMLENEPLPRLRWIEWVEYADLKTWIGCADLCLGIFGTSDKAASVIPNKVFQIVAAQKPLVTRDSIAIRELLKDAPPCVYLVRPGDARALADAIEQHANQLEKQATTSCHSDLLRLIDAKAIGEQFRKMVMEKRDAGVLK
jgi:glycosyltransferase involved in cell wall biosynthesis